MTVADMKKLLVFDLSDSIHRGTRPGKIAEAVREAGGIRDSLRKHGLRYEETKERYKNGIRGYAPRTITVYGDEETLKKHGSGITNAMGTWYTARRITEGKY